MFEASKSLGFATLRVAQLRMQQKTYADTSYTHALDLKLNITIEITICEKQQ